MSGTGPARERIYAVVRRIPPGCVVTYGQVARAAGLGGAARQVGYALHALPTGTRVPWHRVVSAGGRISLRDPGGATEQRFRLEREGVRFGPDDRIDLRTHVWSGVEACLDSDGGAGRTALPTSPPGGPSDPPGGLADGA